MRPLIVFIAVLATTFAAAGAVWAQQEKPKAPGSEPGSEWVGRRLGGARWWVDASVGSRLGLTNEQKVRLDELAKENRAARGEVVSAAQMTYEELLGALTEPKKNDKRIRELRSKFEVLKAREDSIAIDLVVGYREILGSEGFAKLCEILPRACSLNSGVRPGARVRTRRPSGIN